MFRRGYTTKATGQGSTALGYRTYAIGDYTTALGYRAQTCSSSISSGADCSGTTYTGAIVIGDESSVNFLHPTADNQFLVRAAGGVRLLLSERPLEEIPTLLGKRSPVHRVERRRENEEDERKERRYGSDQLFPKVVHARRTPCLQFYWQHEPTGIARTRANISWRYSLWPQREAKLPRLT